MNKKNITLMVVAIATLITFVGLATYAYFVGNINTTRTSNVTATTERNNLVFDTNGGAMGLNVSAANMQRAKNGTVAAQNSTTLTVNLTANTDYSMVCTYDIVYEWTSSDKYIAHSSGVSSNEFTIKASLASNSNTYEGTNNIANETDLSSLTYTNNSATVVSGAQIDATGSTRSTAVWTLESKIYNVNANQTNLVNKNFGGRFKITNVSCVAGNVTSNGPSLITFYVDNHELTAEDGMTWGEWVNSSYNKSNIKNTYCGIGVEQGSGFQFASFDSLNKEKIIALPLATPKFYYYIIYSSGPINSNDFVVNNRYYVYTNAEYSSAYNSCAYEHAGDND